MGFAIDVMAVIFANRRALRHPISGKALRRHCERSEAIHDYPERKLDCFVASLLAMTVDNAGGTTN
jgi:hypothetical protein